MSTTIWVLLIVAAIIIVACIFLYFRQLWRRDQPLKITKSPGAIKMPGENYIMGTSSLGAPEMVGREKKHAGKYLPFTIPEEEYISTIPSEAPNAMRDIDHAGKYPKAPSEDDSTRSKQ